MQKTIAGYPRIGAGRELKFSTEAYLKGALSAGALLQTAQFLREQHFKKQKEKGIDLIPTGDFSFYDNMLDTAVLVGAVPRRFADLNLDPLQTYFAMARGFQDGKRDVRALAMKKWFNTNYHYIVPEIDRKTAFRPAGSQPFDLYEEAKRLEIRAKPVLIGPFTFLKLSGIREITMEDCADRLAAAYASVLDRFHAMGARWVQMDEPSLVTDLTERDLLLFQSLYKNLPGRRHGLEVYLQTYFGDIRDAYPQVWELGFDGVGLDFADGPHNLDLIERYGVPQGKKLLAGVVSGRNIWKNDYKKSLEILRRIQKATGGKEGVILNTSCSLLHVPYTLSAEKKMEPQMKESLSFAEEKLDEIAEIAYLFDLGDYTRDPAYRANQAAIQSRKENPACVRPDVRARVARLQASDFARKEGLEQRRSLQKSVLNLPPLPTTTIGSFPQTSDIKSARKEYREGSLSAEEYQSLIEDKIREIIRFQEYIGLDVLVHGEYERTDMVEYFGRKLEGFLFTGNGWVQSYGTRAVKPPILFGDVRRGRSMTVEWIVYAQSQTERPVKGMLTGPVTILNWSFVREDLALREIAFQLALAIGDEVADLEKNGIRIIQIDEAALREKLPLRREHWRREYLDWAVPAFRLASAKVNPATQIHTHMCYSEFEDIMDAIGEMDADVISIEAARSDFSILKSLKEHNFKPEIGPGIYDIHSPRVPSQEEMEEMLLRILAFVDAGKLWVNPDCGLKTREVEEAVPSLVNMVRAAQRVRERLKESE